ncbi:MAG: zinc ribbon domain-containing protein [Candidatus Hadarchaeales archaeon]
MIDTFPALVFSSLLILIITPLAEAPASPLLSYALDTSFTVWTQDENGWFYQQNYSCYGGDAAQSGRISHNQKSWMGMSVEGPATVIFSWMVDSEYGCDWLSFYIDSSLQVRISGYQPQWERKIFELSAGTHYLKWEYSKDESTSSGLDAGWVDWVIVLQTPTPIEPANGELVTTTDVTFSWSSGGDAEEYQIRIVSEDSTSYIDEYVSTNSVKKRLRPGRYYWQVKSIWGTDESPWSSPTYFRVLPPPELISPTGTVTTIKPTFQWSSVGASYYEIQISKYSWFDPIIIDKQIAGTSYALEEGLEDESSYYWRVKAGEGPWSDVASFHISRIPTEIDFYRFPVEELHELRVAWGERVQFLVQVRSSRGSPTGLVQISCDDGSVSPTLFDASRGSAEIEYVAPRRTATIFLKAKYRGDLEFKPSERDLTIRTIFCVVKAVDKDGIPLCNQRISLYVGGSLVFSGTTNERGEIELGEQFQGKKVELSMEDLNLRATIQPYAGRILATMEEVSHVFSFLTLSVIVASVAGGAAVLAARRTVTKRIIEPVQRRRIERKVISRVFAPIKCPHCKNLNPAGSTYCKECGRPLGEEIPYQPIYCPHCKSVNKPGSTYCNSCGKKIPIQKS